MVFIFPGSPLICPPVRTTLSPFFSSNSCRACFRSCRNMTSIGESFSVSTSVTPQERFSFLQARSRDFHAEITPGHHNPVGNLTDLLHMLHAASVLDLGNDFPFRRWYPGDFSFPSIEYLIQRHIRPRHSKALEIRHFRRFQGLFLNVIFDLTAMRRGFTCAVGKLIL